MKNILLVEPRSPDYNIYSMFKIPRMGLALLGTIADRAGYNIKIIYQEVTPLTSEHIMWADLVGFSLTTSTAPEGYRLARIVRSLDREKSTIIVFGGVHPTFKPEEALYEGDYVFRGEADRTFVPFLDAIKDRASISDIPGVSWKGERGFIHNPMPAERVDMDSLPTPDWSLFEGYTPVTGMIMTSRGCPHDCSFCSVTSMLGRKYRTRSIDNVIKDLSEVECKTVFFFDDHFTANKKRAKELCRRIIDERGKTHNIKNFSAQVRSDIARDPELLDLMKEAGFHHLYIGFESINPTTLELYNKHQSLEDIEYSITEIRKRGIWIHGMFVLGSDADGPETFSETVRFAQKNRIETVQFLILTPLPGSRLYEEFETDGRMLSYDWVRFDAFNAVFLPKLLTPYELQVGAVKAMKKFYSLPSAFRWLFRRQPWIALLHAYAWWTIKFWSWNNRQRIKALRKDSREIFIPEIMMAMRPMITSTRT